MRNLIIKTLILCFIGLFSFSCSDDDKPGENPDVNNNALLGSWGEQFPNDEFFEFTFYRDNMGTMIVYSKNGYEKSVDPFTYTFDSDAQRLTIVLENDPEPPIVYAVKVSEGVLKLDCISGDFDDFELLRTEYPYQ